MNDERVTNAFYIKGSAESFAAGVAAKVPEEFAECVARWHAEKLDAIIEALTEQKDVKEIEDFRARIDEALTKQKEDKANGR